MISVTHLCRTIHLGRTIHLAAVIILVLCFQSAGYALSYWDAIFEIGYNPETQRIDTPAAFRQIERLIEFRAAISEPSVFEENLNSEIREVESQISSLDAGNLYQQLPYSDSEGVWRGIGLRGRLTDNHYLLGIADPAIDDWVNSSKENPAFWGPREQFGDFGFRTFIRPAAADKFRLATENHIHIDDLRLANFMRIIKQVLNALWQSAGANGSAKAVNAAKRFGSSNPDETSLKIINSLAADFPNLFAIFDRYFIIEKIVSKKPRSDAGPENFNILVRVNVNAFKKDYPHLGKLIARVKGMLNFRGAIFDAQNRRFGTLAFDGDKYRLAIQFKTQKGRLLFLGENGNPAKGAGTAGIDLTVPGDQKFYLINDFQLNFVGLKLKIEGLKADLTYYFNDDTAGGRVGIRRPPEEIRAEGRVWGFLPIWLIDFFIPSNIEDMTREFFSTLASGIDGTGVNMLLGSLPSMPSGNVPDESLKDSLWLLANAEILSNGTLRFAFNLQRSMMKEKDELAAEIKLFEQQLWKAFYRDYSRIKKLGSS